MIEKIKRELFSLKNPEKERVFKRFYKTSKGGYSHNEKFLGIPVPKQREIAKKYVDISLGEIKRLLKENIHEYKMTASIILVEKFKKEKSGKIIDFYVENAKLFDNWDLVDLTAPKILGERLMKGERKIIYSFSESKNLWERRIAVVSTHRLIHSGEFSDALNICKKLLEDKEDLINKAVGWTLREIGKKDKEILTGFLKENIDAIPRITLRYSIERFPEKERKFYLTYKLSSSSNLNPNLSATLS
jgi:3-methyladenine DNA glycosylase AlkD